MHPPDEPSTFDKVAWIAFMLATLGTALYSTLKMIG